MARYIDVDKLMQECKNHTMDEVYPECNDKKVVDALCQMGHMFKKIIDETPTADVVEVRHSRWENISGFDVCNICGTSPAYCEPKPNNPKGYPPYCHHCGAKMDGGKAE